MNEVKADHIHKFAAVVGRKMPAATQYRRLKRFRFAKMGIYQKDKRSYSMRGASIIIETTDEKQSSVVQRFDSSDSTMHVIYMFRWPSPPKCRTDNKMRNKNNRRNYNKHEEERRKHTRKTFTFICPFALHFACYYASCGDDGCDADICLSLGLSWSSRRLLYMRYRFYDSLHISCGCSAMAIVCSTLAMR